MKKTSRARSISQTASGEYGGLIGGIAELLETARRTAARTLNALMTATYWEIGRRIVEFEQSGKSKAQYGEEVIDHLASDLTARFGRGFTRSNVFNMRAFYLANPRIVQTASGQLQLPGKIQTTSGKSSATQNSQALALRTPAESIATLACAFPLPWSAYVRLLSVTNEQARKFYEAEALRGGWSVRQLDRQIASQFYERTALSRDKASMLQKGAAAKAGDAISADEELRDPYILEFLNLKDEYSESDLEEALLRHLETFLLELGGDFAFIGRQRRLRIGGEWYRVDLLFFHRKLRCLVVIDLKVGKFSHADAGQMHLYLNYAREHWTQPDENPPVGLILCAEKDDAIAKYALEGLPNKVLAREYKLTLPNEKLLAAEIEKTRDLLEKRTRK